MPCTFKQNLKLKPIVKRSTLLKEEVYHAIKEAILLGDLKPEQRLTLTDLSEVLEVSRTPVRDAVTRLEAENLVQPVNDKGILVIGITRKDLEDIFEIRTFFETIAAINACEKRTQNDLKTMSWLNQSLQRANKEKNVAKLHYFNDSFHYYIFKISKKMSLYLALKNLKDYYRFVRNQQGFEHTALIEQAIQDHIQLVNAFKDRNKNSAKEISEVHALRFRESLLKKYSD